MFEIGWYIGQNLPLKGWRVVSGYKLPGARFLRVTTTVAIARMVETRPKDKARVSLIETAVQ